LNAFSCGVSSRESVIEIFREEFAYLAAKFLRSVFAEIWDRWEFIDSPFPGNYKDWLSDNAGIFEGGKKRSEIIVGVIKSLMVEIEEFMKRIILSGNRREDDYSRYWRAESPLCLNYFEVEERI
jgi:hypothetical protein